MKVLAIGHGYLNPIPRKKWVEIAKYEDVELFLIVPKQWPGYIEKYKFRKGFTDGYEVISLDTIFQGKESRYFYFPNITLSINKIKPDIIHVEQGAGALVYFQAILMKKIFAPKAKCLFFTWWNLPYEIKNPIKRFIEKFNLKNSDYAIVGNADAKNILRQRGYNGPIKILPQLGVDTEVFKKMDVSYLKKELGLDSFVIGFLGRFVYEKGLLTLIEALNKLNKEYKDWQLLLVGRGDLKDQIIDLSKKYGFLEKIVFVDTVPHEEVPKYLNLMDISVLPSLTTEHWKEQFGHVLIEAMACEVPVIGSSSAEIPNVIGDAGLIFKEGNADDLFKKLKLIIENDNLRKDLAKKGRKRVLENYTHEKIAEETYKIYRELLYG